MLVPHIILQAKAASIEAGVKMAEQLIDSGAALKKLEEFIEKEQPGVMSKHK